jgi:hypothetical protein
MVSSTKLRQRFDSDHRAYCDANGWVGGTPCTTQRSSLILLCAVWLTMFGHGLAGRLWKVDWSTWRICILTIRGELKSVSKPQEPNACPIRLTIQTWPQVTSSSSDISNENYLIRIVRAGRDLANAIAEIFAAVNQEVLLNVFEFWLNWLNWVIKHEGKYCTK